MANMVIPNEGKLLWLTWAITGNPPALENFTVHLYSNNYTPVNGSTAGNFTESTFTGYASVPVARTDFGATAIVANVAYSSTTVPPSFTCTAGAPEDAYGWYMLGAVSGKVLAAQRFTNVRSMSPGATESLDPFQFGLNTLV